jgi:hypothetical protein
MIDAHLSINARRAASLDWATTRHVAGESSDQLASRMLDIQRTRQNTTTMAAPPRPAFRNLGRGVF